MTLSSLSHSLPADRVVTVFGGSGFLGRHVVRELAAQGWRIRVAVRRPDLAAFLQPLGTVGQIQAIQANLRFPDSVHAAVKGAHAVINLVGVLHGSGQQSFQNIHYSGAQVIARAAAAAGVAQLVHISALGADAESASAYARTKALGEQTVLEHFPRAIILRPSVVFGPEDDFFNRFAAMARISLALPLIGGGDTRFEPVFVGDVAKMAVKGGNGELKAGTTYELGGNQTLTFKDIMEFVLKITERKRLLLPLPFFAARLFATLAQLIPGKPLTPDQVILLEKDNVVSQNARDEHRTLGGCGIEATALESMVPEYLYRFRKTGQFKRPVAG